MTDLKTPCPDCHIPTAPEDIEWDPGGCRAYYRCLCGRRWWMAWGLTPIAAYDQMAEAA